MLVQRMGKMVSWADGQDIPKDGHGGNVQLQELLSERGSEYAANFSFTILETISTSLSRREVIARENVWKNKLGSRAFGLNLN